MRPSSLSKDKKGTPSHHVSGIQNWGSQHTVLNIRCGDDPHVISMEESPNCEPEKVFYCIDGGVKMMKAFHRRGSWNGLSDPYGRANSGLTCIINEKRVYSIHKHLDISHMPDFFGNHGEENEETTLSKGHSNGSTKPGQNFLEQNSLKQEIDSLQKLIASVQKSKLELEERQTIYAVGLSKQESVLQDLRNLVETKNTRIEILRRKIQFLEDKNLFLKNLAPEYSTLKSALESERLKMKKTKSEIRKNWKLKRESLMTLRQRMAAQKSRETAMLGRELDMMRIMEGLRTEITELKRTNLESLNGKIELIDKMNCVTDTVKVKKETTDKAIQEAYRLRIANAELQKHVDWYRSDMRNDVKEVIYLRWINACLKHELQKKHIEDSIASTVKREKRDDIFEANYNRKNSLGFDFHSSREMEPFEDMTSAEEQIFTETEVVAKIKKLDQQ